MQEEEINKNNSFPDFKTDANSFSVSNKKQSNAPNLLAVVKDEDKQSSNDGLNTERSTDSNPMSKEDEERQRSFTMESPSKHDKIQECDIPAFDNEQNAQSFKKSSKRSDLSLTCNKHSEQDDGIRGGSNTHISETNNSLSNQDEESLLLNEQVSNYQSKTMTIFKLLMKFKKEYALEVTRVLIYALISITIFAYIVDRDSEKKQFYETFYSSEQITISKEINGVFPPLHGSMAKEVVPHKWLLSSSVDEVPAYTSEKTPPSPNQSLVFSFVQSSKQLGEMGVLYIQPQAPECEDQLKFRWRAFDHNIRVTPILESEFEKLEQDQEDSSSSQSSCFTSKDQISQLLREVSIWTTDWQGKQLFLLVEPYRAASSQEIAARLNNLLVLEKALATP